MGTDHCFMRQNIQMLKRGARVRLRPIEKYLHSPVVLVSAGAQTLLTHLSELFTV